MGGEGDGRPRSSRALPTLLAPLGFLILGYAILRSMVQTLRRGGVVWRETHYPIAMLRAGQRVSF